LINSNGDRITLGAAAAGPPATHRVPASPWPAVHNHVRRPSHPPSQYRSRKRAHSSSRSQCMSRLLSSAAILVCAAILAGCPQLKQAPPSPTVRPFGDNSNWVTVEDMVYIIGKTDVKIVVPRGFVTDFASIPQFLWSFGLSPHGQYSRAAVIHDYLYWAQGCSREQSDRLLVIAMKESKVGSFDEFAVYQGVSGFGATAWTSNAKEKTSGLPRIIPEQYIRPPDPNMNWNDYRQVLFKEGVRDPGFDQEPEYCKFGETTTVPENNSPTAAPGK